MRILTLVLLVAGLAWGDARLPFSKLKRESRRQEVVLQLAPSGAEFAGRITAVDRVARTVTLKSRWQQWSFACSTLQAVELEPRRRRVLRGTMSTMILGGTPLLGLAALYQFETRLAILIWPGSYAWANPVSKLLVRERRESFGLDCEI